MTRTAPRRARAWPAIALGLALVAGGCAERTRPAAPAPGSPGDAAAVHAAAPAQILVTLGSVHPAYWRAIAANLVANYDLTLLYSWTMASLGEQCMVFGVPPGGSSETIAARIRRDPRVTLVEPVARFHALGEPWNDAYAHLQHALSELDLAAAQRVATGRGVRIAVVDTGVDLAHPDLQGRISEAKNFVFDGESGFASDVHGTAVAGVIAANANNGIGIVGVAPGAELIALKACWQDPPASRQAVCDSYTLALALDYAVATARPKIINLSLAGPHDPLLAKIVDKALAAGIFVVAAVDESAGAPFPAELDGVLAVGAANPAGKAHDRAWTPGPVALVAAPAEDILSTSPRGAYDFFSGSSFAAAEASGVAALLLEKHPELTPAQLKEILGSTARRPDDAADEAGAPGLLAPCPALARAAGAAVCTPTSN